jgi:hypothetical protein
MNQMKAIEYDEHICFCLVWVFFTWWYVGVGVAGRIGSRIDGRMVVTR